MKRGWYESVPEKLTPGQRRHVDEAFRFLARLSKATSPTPAAIVAGAQELLNRGDPEPGAFGAAGVAPHHPPEGVSEDVAASYLPREGSYERRHVGDGRIQGVEVRNHPEHGTLLTVAGVVADIGADELDHSKWQYRFVTAREDVETQAETQTETQEKPVGFGEE